MDVLDPTLISPVPAQNLGPTNSAVIAYGAMVVLLGIVGIAWLLAKRHAREAAAARAAFDPNAPLEEGPAIIEGIVQHAAAADSAVRVEVEQHATERESSGEWTHVWKEKNRRVLVKPFYIHRRSGERIRVEPSKEVFLVDAMDGVIHVNRTTRVRIAELVPDERVIARGVLRRDFDPEGAPGGYRESPVGWILGPPRRGTLFLSTESLEQRFLRSRRLHRKAAIAVFVGFVAVLALQVTYLARAWLGETSSATVVGKRHYITNDDDGVMHHYELKVRAPWGSEHAEDIESTEFRLLDEGDAAAIRHVGHRLVQPGAKSTMFFVVALIVVIIVGSAAVGYPAAVFAARPWYATKLEDSGDGRIEESTGLGDDHMGSDV